MHASQQIDPDAINLVMRTLGDATRRGLYEQIVSRGEATVVELTRDAGISQPAVSQHLRALRGAGLVAERRAGRNTYYRSSPAGIAPLVDWLDHYAVFWRDRFTALKDLLQEIDPK
jgi:DNA-binding transcriptional ArsR family regulator